MNIQICNRVVMMLHICSMLLESGIVGVTLASLLSELRDEQVSEDHPHVQQREIAMTSASLALAIITFGITMLGAGDTLGGLRLAGKRLSAAGNAIVFKVFGSTKVLKSLSPRSDRKDWLGVQALNENA
jgi:hypothetical protein